MANLIPQAAKRSITIEYWVRVVSVWFVLFGVAALTLAVLNAPIYLLIKNQLQTHSSLFSDANEQNTSYEKIEAEIVAANDNATLLISMRNSDAVVPYIMQIESLSNERITLKSFNVSRKGTAVSSVSLTGVAVDRASLVAFSRAIEDSEAFLEASIPLSNLAKDSDIPFTITAVLVTEES